MHHATGGDAEHAPLLDLLEQSAFAYFQHEVNEANGLVRDNTDPAAPASIAGTGFALSSYPVAVERGYLPREEAVHRTRTALRFLWNAEQSDAPDATGAHGFFYHFLDMQSGRRVWHSELSTIDSAIALAGILTSGAYFDRDTEAEQEIRSLADRIYRRVEWDWALNGGAAISLGWRPERAFIPCRWLGYSEALLLYVLGLGSPTHPLPEESFSSFTSTYRWKAIYGREHVYAGPLFIHQLSHVWLDLRDIRDAFMQSRGIDYFDNSRRATYVQQEYGRRNPRDFDGYSDSWWGVTASDGPGFMIRRVHGRRRRFYGYHARGAPFGCDDGTVSPWAVAASMPFAPEIVIPSLRTVDATYPGPRRTYGYMCSVNFTFHETAGDDGWISPRDYAINQGPVGLMVENYRSGLIWQLLRGCPCIVRGLRRAGFSGGWLDG